MPDDAHSTDSEARSDALPPWPAVLHALRETRGLTRAGFAAHLGVGRTTVQRWELGQYAPNEDAEEALVAFCQRFGLFRPYRSGSLAGITLTEEYLRRLLADARLASLPRGRAGSGRISGPPLAAPSSLLHIRPSRGVPAPPTPLVDREEDVDNLVNLLMTEAVRLVTITGPGGVGKTRLAIETARQLESRFTDGAELISLSALREPSLVTSSIMSVLGLPQRGDQADLEAIGYFLEARQLLLVLDNWEQIERGWELLAGLAGMAGSSKLLVTSRFPTRIRAERTYEVATLSVPDPTAKPDAASLYGNPSVQLFVDRARAARFRFTLSDGNAEDIALICARLEGLPLSIELAAAHARWLSPAEIAAKLEHPLGFLAEGPPDLPERHHTIETTIGWGYALLDPEAQALLRDLSVFAGTGWQVPWAETLWGQLAPNGGTDFSRLLDTLVQHSLVQAVRDRADGVRFRMLEVVRTFAQERLWETADVVEVSNRFLAVVRRAMRDLWSSTDPQLLRDQHAATDRELDNVRLALEWSLSPEGNLHDGMALASSLALYWWRGHIREGLQWYRRLLADARSAGGPIRAVVLLSAGILAMYAEGYKSLPPFMRECVALARSLGMKDILARALAQMSVAYVQQGDGSEALALSEEGVSVGRQAADPSTLASALMHRGNVLARLGFFEEADAIFDEALQLSGSVRDQSYLPSLWGRLGDLEYLRGNWQTARSWLTRAITEWERFAYESGLPQAYSTLGRLNLAEGKLTDAITAFRSGLLLADRSAAFLETLWCLSGFAATCVALGEHRMASDLFGALERYEQDAWVPYGAMFPHELDGCLRVVRAWAAASGVSADAGAATRWTLREATEAAIRFGEALEPSTSA